MNEKPVNTMSAKTTSAKTMPVNAASADAASAGTASKDLSPAAFPSNDSADALVVESINLAKGRMCVRLRIQKEARFTDPRIAVKVMTRFPCVGLHSCKNDSGPHFADVIESTSTAHVLEHLMIDLQLGDSATPMGSRLVGFTQWIDEDKGIAEIQVAFLNDMVALRALRDGVSFLNGILA